MTFDQATTSRGLFKGYVDNINDELLPGSLGETQTIYTPTERAFMCWAIANLAMAGAQVYEAPPVEQAEIYLTKTNASEADRLRTWSLLADDGDTDAKNEMRKALGLSFDENGNTIIGKPIEISDQLMMNRLIRLSAGDKTLTSKLIELLRDAKDTDLLDSLKYAVDICKNGGEEAAYTLAIDRAAYIKRCIESNPNTNRDEISTNVTEMYLNFSHFSGHNAYLKVDRYLKDLALLLLANHKLKQAGQVQGMMLPGANNAFVSAKRYALGLDPTGSYHQAAADYVKLREYDQELEDTNLDPDDLLEITNCLVQGGDEVIIEQYKREVLSPGSDFHYDKPMSLRRIASKLTALYQNGDKRAYSSMLMLSGNKCQKEFISGLLQIGRKDKAIEIARTGFYKTLTYNAALQLLDLCYDKNAMELLQNGRVVGIKRHSRAEIIADRAKALRTLAEYIIANTYYL